MNTSPEKISIQHNIDGGGFFCLHYDRQTRRIECSHPWQTRGEKTLFLDGRPRDEKFLPLDPERFFSRVEPSPDGLRGTTGLYCGVLLDETQRSLRLFRDPHNSGILYWYRDADGLWVSSHLDWLVRACGQKLHIDWSAWAEILSVHFIMGERTLFEEVKCLDLQQIVTLDLDTCSASYENPQWYLHAHTPVHDLGRAARDIAALFDEGMSGLAGAHPHLALALSGGLDSRMLLSCLTRKGAQVDTFAVDTDTGNGKDVEFSRRIARAYRAPYRTIDLAPDWYENTVERYYTLTAYESWYHVWFQGFLDGLPELDGMPLVTGNDGDGLIRSSHMPAPDSSLDLMFDNLDHQNFAPLFRHGLNEAFVDTARQSFRRELGKQGGLPASILFFRLRTRMGRNIHWMLRQGARRFDCISGFQYPPLVEYVLGLPDEIKRAPNLQFEIMRILDPRMLKHPSTHPLMTMGFFPTPIRKFNPAVLEKFHASMEGGSAMQALDLLEPRAVQALFSRLEKRERKTYTQFVKLQPLYMLARWLEAYRDVLVEESPPFARKTPPPPAVHSQDALQACLLSFLPVLEEWKRENRHACRISDALENDYDENYAPAAGAVVLARALHYTPEAEALYLDYLKRSVELLNTPGLRNFQKVFLLHYLCLSLLMLPAEVLKKALPPVRRDLARFRDACRILNTNCATLQMANELFLEALHIRRADIKGIHRRMEVIEAARLESGFINDHIEVREDGQVTHGDGMPPAYHAFILFVLACTRRFGTLPKRIPGLGPRIDRLLAGGLLWLDTASAPDGSFAMAGRSKYHLFTRGVRAALFAFCGDLARLAPALRLWSSFARPDGTYDVTLNHLPHGLRAGYEGYAHVDMYNTLGMAALAVCDAFLHSYSSTFLGTQPQPGGLSVEPAAGYAFYRQEGHFVALNLNARSQETHPPVMGTFHLRLAGQPTCLAEPFFDQDVPPSAEGIQRHLFEGFLFGDPERNWRTPSFTSASASPAPGGGVLLSAEDACLTCMKTLRFTPDSLRITWRVTPRVALHSLVQVLPVTMSDGADELSIDTPSPQVVNLLFGQRAYRVTCHPAKRNVLLLERSLLSVSGCASRLQFVLCDGPLPAGQPFEWELEVKFLGNFPKATPRNMIFARALDREPWKYAHRLPGTM